MSQPDERNAPEINGAPAAARAPVPETENCEYCGNDSLIWRKCKQICRECGQINRSCADL